MDWFKTHPQVKGWTIGGNNGRIAATNVKREYPRNKKFSRMSCTVYGCSKLDSEAKFFAKNFGGIDNVIASIMQKTTFVDRVKNCHSAVVDFRARNPQYKDEALPTKFNSEVVAQKAAAWAIPKPSVTQMMQIAKWQGRLWDSALKILTGSYFGPPGKGGRRLRGKVIESSHYFTDFGGMRTADIQNIMDKVLRGKLAVRYMRNEASKLKARKRIITYICNKLDPDATEPKEIDELVKDNPSLFRDAFLNPWVLHVSTMRKKDALPTTFQSAVKKLMTQTSSVIYSQSQ
jgi:hypothetical protein